MATLLKTPLAAKALGCTYHKLFSLIRLGKLDPPSKDSSGDYLWSEEDLSRARVAMATDRRRKPPASAGQEPV